MELNGDYLREMEGNFKHRSLSFQMFKINIIPYKIEKRKQQEIDRQNGIGVRRVSNNLIIGIL